MSSPSPLIGLSGLARTIPGLKGTRVGNIEVSPVHANYLVNLGGGTAEDALALIDLVRKTVHEKLGIELESEVRIVGEP